MDTVGSALVFVAIGGVVVVLIVWAIARYVITALNRLLDE